MSHCIWFTILNPALSLWKYRSSAVSMGNIAADTRVGTATEPDPIQALGIDDDLADEKPQNSERHEVFQDSAEGVKFRTVSWQSATVIFLKIQFAMSILSVPGSFATLGAVGGALSLVGWQVLNTCMPRSIFRSREAAWLTLDSRYCSGPGRLSEPTSRVP